MTTPSFSRRLYLLLVIALFLVTFRANAITIFLQEQGGLTGSLNGGSGTITINQVATDHWHVIVQDPRIGNPINPGFSLAFTEPETVFGLTAYNNVQMLSVTPGVAHFDVLSDEFSPYSTILPNGAVSPFQNTDVEMISMKFTDFADSVPEPGTGILSLMGVLLLARKASAEARS
jgi:hypothetical protein